jgi:cupin 2 domain-containing protein
MGLFPLDNKLFSLGNFFDNLPMLSDVELVESIVESNHIRIERIISTGQSSPPEFWYDQNETEWVIVLSGEAILEFENEVELKRLCVGDYVLIPAHCKHRIAQTAKDKPTIWLAIFFDNENT